MIAVTINSSDSAKDLETAKQIEITSCDRVEKFCHNFPRPISVTFAKRDDKESFLSNKWQLPTGIFANEEFPLHVKCNRDRLRPIWHLAKSLLQYQARCKMISNRLIPNLPLDLAAYKAAEKSYETHLVFAGDLSLYSNLHHSPFTINGQQFHSREQWIQVLTYIEIESCNNLNPNNYNLLVMQLNIRTQHELKQLLYKQLQSGCHSIVWNLSNKENGKYG